MKNKAWTLSVRGVGFIEKKTVMGFIENYIESILAKHYLDVTISYFRESVKRVVDPLE